MPLSISGAHRRTRPLRLGQKAGHCQMKVASNLGLSPNPAVDLAPFGRWTLRDKTAQCRSPLR